MKFLFSLSILIGTCTAGDAQTSFTNPTEGIAVPILKLSSYGGGVLNSGGSIEFYKGTDVHPMGRIYTSNQYSNGTSSVGKLILSSYEASYRMNLLCIKDMSA